jgi:hydroxymethylglutaryl-CoA lyase
MPLPSKVSIVDVGPRDGLQNEKQMIPADVKVELVDRLTDAGFRNIEVTSFVSPKWVPQMADGAEVMARIRRKPGVVYSVLVPNMKGFEARAAAKADEIVVFGAASEAFSQKNINCSIAESIERFRPVCEAARASTASACAAPSPARSAARTRAKSRPRRWATSRADEGDRRAAHRRGRHHRRRHAARRRRRRWKRRSRTTTADVSGHFHDTYGRPPPTSTPAWNWASRLRHQHRRARRLPVCQGRDRQRRHRGRAVPAATPAWASTPASIWNKRWWRPASGSAASSSSHGRKAFATRRQRGGDAKHPAAVAGRSSVLTDSLSIGVPTARASLTPRPPGDWP